MLGLAQNSPPEEKIGPFQWKLTYKVYYKYQQRSLQWWVLTWNSSNSRLTSFEIFFIKYETATGNETCHGPRYTTRIMHKKCIFFWRFLGLRSPVVQKNKIAKKRYTSTSQQVCLWWNLLYPVVTERTTDTNNTPMEETTAYKNTAVWYHRGLPPRRRAVCQMNAWDRLIEGSRVLHST